VAYSRKVISKLLWIIEVNIKGPAGVMRTGYPFALFFLSPHVGITISYFQNCVLISAMYLNKRGGMG
jgi:hypothetical protein